VPPYLRRWPQASLAALPGFGKEDTLIVLVPVLLGYLLGSLPFGYLIVKALRGIDIREYGSHNIGATNVLRVVGRVPALLTLVGDIGKGAIPPILATMPLFSPNGINGWVVVSTALAAIAGHAYSLYFYILERRFARGKAVATGAGAMVGFVLAGEVSWVALVIVLGVWVIGLLSPRLVSSRFGWVSLSSILAAVTMPVAFLLVNAPLPYILFAVAAALFVLWKHKENIGRLLDGVEPRLGERVPLAGVDRTDVACAFLIHCFGTEDWWQSRRFSWALGLHRCGLLPLPVLNRLSLLLRPIKADTITGIRTPDGRNVQVHLICVPWQPDQIKAHPKLAVRRAVQAARLAKELGARCLGLGAYWSVVGNKGADVQQAAPFIPITNGGAFTAGSVRDAVPTALTRLGACGVAADRAVAAVVGANGVVGFGICRQLGGQVSRLILIGTDLVRLERSAVSLRRRYSGLEVDISIDPGACREADLIFTATSNVDPVLFPEHVKPGAVIYDLGRPADVDPSVLQVEAVSVIPGGIVRPPGTMRHRLDTHFDTGMIPACMAETILMALEECYERTSLGELTQSENVEYFVQLAERLDFVVVAAALPPPAAPAADCLPVLAEGS
jgi:acyl-phosphate glycerol 3-phosphate acyltransferase